MLLGQMNLNLYKPLKLPYKHITTKNAIVSMRFSHHGQQTQLPLVGPPELSRFNPSKTNRDSSTADSTANSSTSGDPFMDAMLSKYNKLFMGRTENNSPTYLSSGNPCLDFFFHVVPDTPSKEVTSRLKLAWDQDASTALKLVCNLRGVRGTGKSDREGFYASVLWLQDNHPKTLAGNVASFAEFGYYKDLVEILYRLIEGPHARESEKELLMSRRMSYGDEWWKNKTALKNNEIKPRSQEEKRLAAAKMGLERYYNDPKYRFLHDRISELFAEHLRSDLEKIRCGKYNNLTLAAKWCPSLDSRFDHTTLICESIARRLFPREKYPEYEGIEEAYYAYRVRDRLRKEVLVPLRRALKLPEVYIGAGEWNSIVYTRVASIAMSNYTCLFMRHDGERFQAYLDSVMKGEAKIAAGALLPHEIVESVESQDSDEVAVAELQWRRIVEDLSDKGKLKNCLAICDVSGSMYGLPLEVSVALGLLVSELSEEPWKGKLITFSNQPQLQVIKGKKLKSKICSIKKMDWEMNTDFQRVFDRILEVAVEGKLTEEQMIKRLFVFSDMEFDQASANDWETDYQAIVRKFQEKGFCRVPEIVFWNLRNSMATPVPSHQKGVALVSGFSKNFLKLFLDKDGVLNPLDTMMAAIAGPEYDKLVVLD